MNSGIFSIRDGNLTELSIAPFDAEAIFQELLGKHPSLIAGDQIDSDNPRRWLLVRREMGVPGEENGYDRWALDHLFLDQDGIPTLVEVKRSTDTRLRREVVGQMLDYAANAVAYWPAEAIESQFRSRCEGDDLDPDVELERFLEESSTPDEFWGTVKTNLQARKIRLLFVADVIPTELKQIVEFLNSQMDPAEVLALEIKRYAGGGQETLVPRIYGQTAEAERKKGGGRLPAKKWDEASFFAAAAERNDPALIAAMRAIYDWSKTHGFITWGQGAKSGSFMVSLTGGDDKVFYIYSHGGLSFNPTKLPKLPPFHDAEVLNEMVQRLEAVPHLTRHKQSGWQHTWVSYRLDDLDGATGLHQLLSVLDSLFTQLKSWKGGGQI